jgi:hypothetical protein
MSVWPFRVTTRARICMTAGAPRRGRARRVNRNKTPKSPKGPPIWEGARRACHFGRALRAKEGKGSKCQQEEKGPKGLPIWENMIWNWWRRRALNQDLFFSVRRRTLMEKGVVEYCHTMRRASMLSRMLSLPRSQTKRNLSNGWSRLWSKQVRPTLSWQVEIAIRKLSNANFRKV